MADRSEYKESISLIREAESLIKESNTLLNEIKNCIDDKNGKAEMEALREAVSNLRMRNDCLYMENVLLKSKIRELSMMINYTSDNDTTIKDYFTKK